MFLCAAPPPRPPTFLCLSCVRPLTGCLTRDSIPYTVLLLLWGGVFGVLYTELDDPFNPALNNVSQCSGAFLRQWYLPSSLVPSFVSGTFLRQ